MIRLTRQAVPLAIVLSGLALTLLTARPALGHPVPKDQYDRKIKVRLTRQGSDCVEVFVHYRLELDELTAVNDFLDNYKDEVDLSTAKDKRNAMYSALAKCLAPDLAANVILRVGGQ